MARPPVAKHRPARAAGPGAALTAYRLLTDVVRPAVPFFLGVRARRHKEDSGRRAERLGHAGAARPEGVLVWVHAASVGETNAILPLLSLLRERVPELRFLLTTGTVTSAEVARRRLREPDIHQFAPLDAREYVCRFLDHWRPALAVFTESEIWPNLVLESAARGLPLALVNARMSDSSFRRWRRLRRVCRPLLGRFSVVLAQNEELAGRFRELGAPDAIAAGNLKIDAPPPPVDREEAGRLSAMLAGRAHLVAASTHEGEDETLGAAHRVLSAALPGFCTIVVPRHPERGERIASLLSSRGLSVARRSTGALPCRATEVYVADTIGELGTLYAVSSIAFIGGSLVERGGQNPIEAVRHGAAVLTGPHMENFHDAYRALLRHDGARIVRSSDDLARTVLSLLENAAELERMRAGAAAALATLSGALERTVSALLPLLPAEVATRAPR